ncbi:ABC transporter ATP-binding protein [Chloroflexota bacterium]
MIKINKLSFNYPSGTKVFDNFSWTVASGASWAIIGSSGCGKSTLLYLVAGLLKQVAGLIEINGEPVTRVRPETGLILQDYGLLPWATIRQNVELGLRIRRFYGPDGKHVPQSYNPKDTQDKVELWLTRLGISGLADKFPGQVSGGQRQRTAIARTLVLEPDLLLMDEPFSSLDVPTREDLQQVVLELQQETGMATIIVTHNIDEAVFMGRKILVLSEPPNQKAQIVNNPGETTSSYRNSARYIRRSNEIRELMGLLA